MTGILVVLSMLGVFAGFILFLMLMAHIIEENGHTKG
jgi:hypothetical protein